MTRMSRFAGLIALALAAVAPLRAGQLSPAKGSLISIQGSSTLHPFWSTSTVVGLDFKLDQAAGESAAAAVKAGKPAQMTVTVHVADLKNEHSGLDKNLRNTLKADKFPDIVFKLDSYKALEESGAEKIVAPGQLTISGTTKPVTLNAVARAEDGKLVVDGDQPILMTDFGIKPPSLMLGALKVDNKVVVKFHLVLEQAASDAKGK